MSTSVSLRSKLDIYLFVCGSGGQPPDFDCIQRLRRSSDPNVAYAPMMLVAGRLTPQALKAAIDAGFDDILLQPVGSAELYARIVAAITSPQPFYASPDYAGPDRRRGMFAASAAGDRRDANGRVSRILIERSIAGGCRVRRTERIGAAAATALATGDRATG